ncbi:unnamed protein product [Acanthoscelides obtectus]|uniref:Uncharacterized protein n=1 Tax=Acanthoscelides obtectus TaxID=200917 RepID=A0A9P0JL12_ACAOB|nr:unnamed protein product [Acanthoscelides obtectus]CAK1639823.1 hypothetical protein AOBTE_LOCUS11393 [Acanthoscelides obtectus]
MVEILEIPKIFQNCDAYNCIRFLPTFGCISIFSHSIFQFFFVRHKPFKKLLEI